MSAFQESPRQKKNLSNTKMLQEQELQPIDLVKPACSLKRNIVSSVREQIVTEG